METGALVATLLLGGVAAYAGAWVCHAAGRNRAGLVLFAAGWSLNLGLFIVNWLVAGAPPFGAMYHVLVCVAGCFLPVLLVMRRRRVVLPSLGAYLSAAAALVLTGSFFLRHEVSWRRMAALQSPWFVPHVTAYVISYALAAVAFALSAAGWFSRRREGEGGGERRLAADELIRLAFPFMTFGLCSGMLWADAAWGSYWSWDPKETWSLITWLLYALSFHCRGTRRLERLAVPAQAAAFTALLVTFLLVNLLPRMASPLHGFS